MLVTAVVIGLVIWLVDHTARFAAMTKGRRTMIKMVGVFVVILIINLLWRPYGATG